MILLSCFDIFSASILISISGSILSIFEVPKWTRRQHFGTRRLPKPPHASHRTIFGASRFDVWWIFGSQVSMSQFICASLFDRCWTNCGTMLVQLCLDVRLIFRAPNLHRFWCVFFLFIFGKSEPQEVSVHISRKGIGTTVVERRRSKRQNDVTLR